MSDTPQTDEAEARASEGGSMPGIVCAEFARRLERELAAFKRTDTPNKEDDVDDARVQRPQPELAILDVINALRAVVAALKPRKVTNGVIDIGTVSIISTDDAETLLNLLEDAEQKLQLP